MSNPFVGEIRAVGFSFAPRGWALCNGQLIPISQNTALFSLLGTFYGGDGRTTFALPNLQGSFCVGTGQGPGLSEVVTGEQGGASAVALVTSQMPLHSHTPAAAAGPGDQASPQAAIWAEAHYGRALDRQYSTAAPSVAMAPNALATAGGSQPHNNMSPYLTLNFIIAMQGVFPARS
ncbi:MAG: microcystin dependent protein [Marmoricola sp.]|nr:microcystin dependent protein [Marmoricola sp.]